MAHLTDMEELLGSIPSKTTRDYMRDAMNCYMANAYRGCIVMSYIALFDDLLSKLEELSKVNIVAKSLFIEATRRKEDQEVFESYLIDQLHSKNLLSGLDEVFLNTLRTLRNKSAHPSGHKPSPEEARFIFFEVITRFLSHPILSTTQLVDEIIIRLSNTNFFPQSNINEIKLVVEDEVKVLNEAAVPQLIAKLSSLVVSSDELVAKNAQVFLLGLTRLNRVDIDREINNKILNSKTDDPKYANLILQIISANGKLILTLSHVNVTRFKQLISTQIDEVTTATSESKLVHPISTLNAIAEHINESALLDGYKEELEKLFEKLPYSPYLIKLLENRPFTFKIYFQTILLKAESSTFLTANSFVSAMDNIEKELSVLVSDEQAFQIVVAILQAAEWGANRSKSLRSAKFASTPNLRTKAVQYSKSNSQDAEKYFRKKLGSLSSAIDFISDYLSDEVAE